MPKDLKLSVPQPCQEDYTKFEVRPEGGFCQACQTTVVDFTKMSDAEIKAYFAKSRQKVCGKFTSDQLNRELKSPLPIASKSWFNRAALLSIPFLSIFPFSELKAQVQPKPLSSQQHEPTNAPTESQRDTNELKAPSLLGGKVIDAKTGETIPFANIVVNNGERGASTDIDGIFSFKDPLKPGDVLEVSFVGYQKVKYTVVAGKAILIKMPESSEIGGEVIIMYGKVATDKAYESNISTWQRFKALFQ